MNFSAITKKESYVSQKKPMEFYLLQKFAIVMYIQIMNLR